MKLTTTKIPKFQPIGFTITIESEEELKALWAKFNVNAVAVINVSDSNKKITNTDSVHVLTQPLFHMVNDELKRLGLK